MHSKFSCLDSVYWKWDQILPVFNIMDKYLSDYTKAHLLWLKSNLYSMSPNFRFPVLLTASGQCSQQYTHFRSFILSCPLVIIDPAGAWKCVWANNTLSIDSDVFKLYASLECGNANAANAIWYPDTVEV